MTATAFKLRQVIETRNGYIVASAFTIAYAALFSASLPGRQVLSAASHALVDFKVLWVCILVGLWRIASTSSRDLRLGDVIWGGLFAILAAVTAGLWPWLCLAAFAGAFLTRTKQHEIRQALFLLLAIGIHETVVTICGEVFGDALLSLDASIAQFLTHWFLPELLASGTTLQVSDVHSVALVWGCSSLSYVGDMMLLCWALTLLLGDKKKPGGDLWKWLALVATMTVALNAARLALMATSPPIYHFLHDGFGAVIFRIIILTGAVSIAWLQSSHAIRKPLSVA
jgi:exosortase/archaeosortase family protein